ncbi:hypothetical protein GCM10007928_51920 [Sulfitobacter porphyrae]|nr:hypothetical protein GCM10007928_51920 [Sulfitobacter porphyrae]
MTKERTVGKDKRKREVHAFDASRVKIDKERREISGFMNSKKQNDIGSELLHFVSASWAYHSDRKSP